MNRFKEKNPAEEAYEKCAYCNKQLDIPRDTPVERREHYVRGCGQFCPTCYSELMRPVTADSKITNAELEYLLNASRK